MIIETSIGHQRQRQGVCLRVRNAATIAKSALGQMTASALNRKAKWPFFTERWFEKSQCSLRSSPYVYPCDNIRFYCRCGLLPSASVIACILSRLPFVFYSQIPGLSAALPNLNAHNLAPGVEVLCPYLSPSGENVVSRPFGSTPPT